MHTGEAREAHSKRRAKLSQCAALNVLLRQDLKAHRDDHFPLLEPYPT